MDSISSQLLAKIPAGRPPPGVKPNFVDPPSLKGSVIAVNVVFMALATTVVALRIYTRRVLIKRFGWDDYVCIVALLATATHSALHLYVVGRNQGGRHIWDIPAIKITPQVGHNLLAGSLSYGPAIYFVKLSALLLIHHIFGVNKTLRYFIYGGIIFLSAFCLFNIAVFSVAEALCVTAANLTTPYCAHLWISSIIQGVLNTLTDIYVLVLPISMILRLRLPKKRKIGICLTFLTGLL